MTRINLLPWREARQAQRQRDLGILLAVAAAFAVGIVFLVYSEIANRIDYQKERNDYLRAELARLKKAAKELESLKKTRDRLVGRLEVIQKLQASRPGMVRMLDELVRLKPEPIFMTSFSTTDNQVVINGVAQDDTVISAFMRELRKSVMFGEPVLRLVQTKTINDGKDVPGVQARVFELAVPLKLGGDDVAVGSKKT